MHPLSRRTAVSTAAALVLAGVLSAAALPAAVAAPSRSDSSAKAQTADTGYALVQLGADPLATAGKTKPAKGKKLDFNNGGVKSYRAVLAAQRKDFKAWLKANLPGVKVTGEYDISLNAVAVKLNGATLAQLAAAPMVKRAEYQGLYRPTAVDPDLSLIRAVEAWNQAGGAADAGEGVKVAVIDSGIDVRHPCFADAGYPATAQLGVKAYTNNKVIAAKVFNNKASNRGYTPEAVVTVMRFAFDELRLHRLEICIIPRNTNSRRVVEKLQVRDEGVALRFLEIAGTWEDHIRYAMSTEDWADRRAELAAIWL